MNNMKHSVRSLTSGALMAAVALMATGCSSEENTSTAYVAEGTPITVNAVVGEMETKAGYSDENLPQTFYLKIEHPTRENFSYYALMDRSTGSWVAYDGKSSTTPPTELKMYWAGDGNPVKVTAATYDFSTSSEPSVQTDQSKSIDGSDVLVMLTDDDVAPATAGIDVTLKHLMAKLKVKVDMGKETNYTENLITDFVVGGTQTKRAFDLGTNTFSDPTATTVDDIKAYTDAKTMFTPSTLDESVVTAAATANYEAILVPQEVKTGVLEINFSLGNKSYNWTSTKDFTFESNKQYTLTLKLIGDKVAMKDVSVSGWVDTPQNLGTGELAEAIDVKVLTISDNGGDLTADKITTALAGGTALKIVGAMNSNDVNILKEYYYNTAGKITYLDLSEIKQATTTTYTFTDSDFGLFFTNNADLETLILPSEMTTLATNCCYGCKNLKSVTLPEGLTSLSKSAFSGCTSLPRINIPKGVTSIAQGAFQNCTKLTKVNFMGAVKSIGKEAFRDCKSFVNIQLPTTLETIGESAFNGCSSLTSIDLPATVTSIGQSAFTECTGLSNVTIPANSALTTIINAAFEGCTSLTNVTLPSSLTTLDTSVFSGCVKLTEMTLPSNVTVISNELFQNCTKLTKVTCEAKVTKIGENPFKGSGLKDLDLTKCDVLPSNVQSNSFWNLSVNVHLNEKLFSNYKNDGYNYTEEWQYSVETKKFATFVKN